MRVLVSPCMYLLVCACASVYVLDIVRQVASRKFSFCSIHEKDRETIEGIAICVKHTHTNLLTYLH